MAENLVVRNNPLLDIDSVDTENPRALEDDMADDEEPGSPTFDVLKTRDLTEFEEEDDAFPPWRQKAKEIDAMVPKMALSAIATILALFLADIRNWLLPESMDVIVDGLHIFCVIFFIAEISLQLCANRAYYTNLFFWLDVAATISLVPELPIGGSGGEAGMGSIFRAGRAARAGARAGRLQGLVRIAKVFKLLTAAIPQDDESTKPQLRQPKSSSNADVVPESIGSQVTHKVARIMIIVVITAMIITTVFQYDADTHLHQELGLKVAMAGADDTESATNVCKAWAQEDSGLTNDPEVECNGNTLRVLTTVLPDLYYLKVGDAEPLVDNRDANTKQIRDSGIFKETSADKKSEAWFNDSEASAMSGEFSFYTTCSVVILLVSAGFVLSTEMNSLIALPMLRLVKSQALSDSLLLIFQDSKDPLPTLRESARSILSAEIVNIYFVDESTDSLYFSNEGDTDSPYDGQIRMKIGQGLAGRAAAGTEPQIWSFAAKEELPSDDPALKAMINGYNMDGKRSKKQTEWWAESIMCYPLLQQVGTRQSVVGVIQAINKIEQNKSTSLIGSLLTSAGLLKKNTAASFDDNDTEMVQMLGGQLAKILKSFQMDAMYENIFSNTDDDADVMQGMMAAYATPDFVAKASEPKKSALSLRELFEKIDVDGGGTLDRDEVGELATSLGKPLTESELDDIMREMDKDGEGAVDFEEFEHWWNNSSSELATMTKEKFKIESAAVSTFMASLKLPSTEELRTWGFGCLDLNLDQLVGCCMLMITDADLGIASEFGLDADQIMGFCRAAMLKYKSIPYHNMYHAINVMQGCYALLMTTEVGGRFTMIEKLAMLVAGLGHDIGHDGVNTAFHVAAESDLAATYNDRSPLENMHSTHCFAVMKDASCDILAPLDGGDRKQVRKIIVDAIIGTDMAFHKQHIDDMAKLQSLDMDEAAVREELLAGLVHLCDVGASTYEWTESTRWARMITTEMHAQVELERANGLPRTAFMDLGDDATVTTTLAKGQVGFISFVLVPFFGMFPPHIPEIQAYVDELKANKEKWAEIAAGDRSLPSINAAGKSIDHNSDDKKLAWSTNIGELALVGGTCSNGLAAPVSKLTSGKLWPME